MKLNSDDLDRDLQALFQESSRKLEAEAFVRSTMTGIQRRRSLRNLAGFCVQAIVIIAIFVESPKLIRGSAWLSDSLSRLFDFGGEVLSRPPVMILAVLVTLAVLFINERLLKRFPEN